MPKRVMAGLKADKDPDYEQNVATDLDMTVGNDDDDNHEVRFSLQRFLVMLMIVRVVKMMTLMMVVSIVFFTLIVYLYCLMKY